MSTTRTGKWWLRELAGVCDPISLDPIRTLKYPPFELRSDLRPNQKVHDDSDFYDGAVLANFLVSTGNFFHPISRRELTREECAALDAYLKENRLPGGSVVAAYDQREAYKAGTPPSGSQFATLRAEADMILQSLFANSSARRMVGATSAAARQAGEAVSTDGNMSIVDDDQRPSHMATSTASGADSVVEISDNLVESDATVGASAPAASEAPAVASVVDAQVSFPELGSASRAGAPMRQQQHSAPFLARAPQPRNAWGVAAAVAPSNPKPSPRQAAPSAPRPTVSSAPVSSAAGVLVHSIGRTPTTEAPTGTARTKGQKKAAAKQRKAQAAAAAAAAGSDNNTEREGAQEVAAPPYLLSRSAPAPAPAPVPAPIPVPKPIPTPAPTRAPPAAAPAVPPPAAAVKTAFASGPTYGAAQPTSARRLAANANGAANGGSSVSGLGGGRCCTLPSSASMAARRAAAATQPPPMPRVTLAYAAQQAAARLKAAEATSAASAASAAASSTKKIEKAPAPTGAAAAAAAAAAAQFEDELSSGAAAALRAAMQYAGGGTGGGSTARRRR